MPYALPRSLRARFLNPSFLSRKKVCSGEKSGKAEEFFALKACVEKE
jgi:hypothetical protein